MFSKVSATFSAPLWLWLWLSARFPFQRAVARKAQFSCAANLAAILGQVSLGVFRAFRAFRVRAFCGSRFGIKMNIREHCKGAEVV